MPDSSVKGIVPDELLGSSAVFTVLPNLEPEVGGSFVARDAPTTAWAVPLVLAPGAPLCATEASSTIGWLATLVVRVLTDSDRALATLPVPS